MTAARIPTYTADEIIKKLQKLGFNQRPRTGSSHVRLFHPEGRRVTVPLHKGEDVGRGLLRKILRDINVSPDEFANI